MKPRGRIKAAPEDFVVEEIPVYEPSGAGDHLFVFFEKKNLTTDQAVKELARALGVDRREIGVAGMKDKVGITRQWISLPAFGPNKDIESRVSALAIDGVAVLEAKRHGNKLKTGHLRANRFTITIRDVDDVQAVRAAFDRIAKEGVPNAFGAQRFGRFGDTHEQARAWLTGKARAPSDPRMRRFHFSALQSKIFNEVLDARVADGTWTVPQLGDVLEKDVDGRGGLFVCTDVQLDRERASRGEVCPTGPMVGDRMKRPEGEVGALEDRIAAPFLEGVDLVRARALGEGTRRKLRLRADTLTITQVMESKREGHAEQASDLTVCFVLPKGAYATTVLANVFELSDSSGGPEEEE